MSGAASDLSARARSAAQAAQWPVVESCAKQLLRQDRNSAEGHFLLGLASRAARLLPEAARRFQAALSADSNRYDAAVELADVYLALQQHPQSFRLLEDYRERLNNSPRYLDLAATTYTHLGMPEKAWPLHQRANELQPNVQKLQANMAACAIQVGRIAEAKTLYQALLDRNPNHQRNHFQLSGLSKASDLKHVEQMKTLLEANQLPPEQNIFLYYAIAKELEDLEQWDEAFDYYKLAGDTVSKIANYDPAVDEKLIDTVISVCSKEWIEAAVTRSSTPRPTGTPIFIVGLPRTGTTLVERIVSSHSRVESVGETHFMEMVIQREGSIRPENSISPAIIEAAARVDSDRIATAYLNEVQHRLGGNDFFIEKYPENVLFAGLIARAFPDGRIVHLQRDPMDACFALYKQSYFRFAYTLDALGRYYIAYDRLVRHWRDVLGARLIEIRYEELVGHQERETRFLLDNLGLDFEQACLEFDRNPTASATASSVQVRQKIHSGSIGKWRRFEKQLQPLRLQLEDADIKIN